MSVKPGLNISNALV